jgi:hypothetical protein
MTEPRRSDAQNRKWRAVLTDMSRCKPEGRELTPDQWQVLLFAGWDYDRRFGDLQLMEGLEGRPPVPVNGYSTSILTVNDMAELITFALAYGDRHGVQWSGGDYDVTHVNEPSQAHDMRLENGTEIKFAGVREPIRSLAMKLENDVKAKTPITRELRARPLGQGGERLKLKQFITDPLVREALNRTK